MIREFLKAKIHRARITEANLEYDGSITIDEEILKASGILPFERVHIYNISNGHRLDTYAIPGAPGSGTIGLNGAAARLGHVGDIIIIVAYCSLQEEEIAQYHPRIVLMDEHNSVKQIVDK